MMPVAPRRRSGWWSIIFVVLAFWTFWFLSQSTYNLIDAPGDVVKYAVPRTLVASSGMALSLAIAVVVRKLGSYSLSVRALVTAALTLAATVLHGMIAREIWKIFAPEVRPTSALWIVFATDFLMRFWFFATQSAIILAQSYASDVREREERIHSLRALAHSAQLRALRNQLNPHFLFNALNSIAGLMRTRKPAAAETMVENLGDFLRTTLSLDPQSMIALDEELRLQDLYLSIEKVRFPDRLNIQIDVPSDLEKALVPSLVTQPLIENSIKYAVARSTDKVTLRVAAERSGNSLILTVADDGGNADPVLSASSHLGLRNISERLAVHFGDEARIESHPLEGRGYINRVTLPLRLAE
jgi:sensor histidine kinase YesM